MRKKWKKVDKDRFKGKRIELAPTTGIDIYRGIAEDFMQNIFDLAPGDYLITDESSLHDFTGFEVEIENFYTRIIQEYDLDVSDIERGNLLEIFKRIHRKRF